MQVVAEEAAQVLDESVEQGREVQRVPCRPHVVVAVRIGRGVKGSLVGRVTRPDGSTQLTYGGHPLYTYVRDVRPGMVTGQAIDQDGGLWYVLNAKGQQITTAFSVMGSNLNGTPNPNGGPNPNN